MRLFATIFFALLFTLSFSLKAQWVSSSNGLPNTFGVYNAVNTIAKSGNVLFVSYNQTISLSSDEGNNWVDITNKFPANSRFTFLAGNDSKLFVALDTLNGNVRNGRLFYTEDGGTTWVETGLIASAGSFGAIAVKGDTVYVHGGMSYSYRSTDGGNSWTKITVPDRGSETHIVGSDVYIANDFNVFRSTDMGQSWIESPGIGAVPSLLSVGSNIYAGTRSGIYKSTDNAGTWTTITNGLPGNNVAKKILYANNSNLIISIAEGSVSNGVHQSTDGGQTWVTFMDGFPNTSHRVSGIVVLNGYLYASTGASGFLQAGVYKRSVSELTTGIKTLNNIPGHFSLKQNYPNPFNPSTTIEFSISQTENVSLKIYNTIGEEIASLLNEILSPGSYKINFNAESLSSGVYIYRLSSGNLIQTQKMTLLK